MSQRTMFRHPVRLTLFIAGLYSIVLAVAWLILS